MPGLHLAPNLTLPLETVTQTIAILAKRRAGKSYAMRRLVEQLFKAKQQVVLVDPKGDQWGLRSTADGKGPGLPIVILGGERGDVPLEASGGEVVAKLVVEDRVSALLDLSLFRKSEVATFMTAFLENVYRLKARELYRTPMMLVVDEADAIAPQKPQHGEERMLGAAEDIVRRGGQRGIGCVLVTQRSAVLNKNVLTQAQVLVVLRTIAPQDLAAMDAWIQVHGDPDHRKTLMDSLPSLPVGDAWFWSPGWPTVEGIFKRVHVSAIETFDSGATPAPGAKPAEPKQLADVDLAVLTRQMAATIARAKADDPKELRKRIATLERELAKAQAPTAAPASVVERIEVPILQDGTIARLETAIGRLVADVVVPLQPGVKALFDIAETIRATLRAATAKQPAYRDNSREANPPPVERPSRATARPATGGGAAAAAVSPARQKILNALAFLAGIGVEPADKTQLALMAGVSPTSGGYFNNLGTLRTSGLVDYPSSGTVALTAAGLATAWTDGVPTTTGELHAAIQAKLPPAKWRIVEVLIAHYPKALSKDDLAHIIGVSPTSGGYFNNLGSLRSLGLIDYPQPGYVTARPILFLAGKR